MLLFILVSQKKKEQRHTRIQTAAEYGGCKLSLDWLLRPVYFERI
jgi:hypothetical protein